MEFLINKYKKIVEKIELSRSKANHYNILDGLANIMDKLNIYYKGNSNFSDWFHDNTDTPDLIRMYGLDAVSPEIVTYVNLGGTHRHQVLRKYDELGNIASEVKYDEHFGIQAQTDSNNK